MYRLCPKEEKCTVLGIVPKKKTKAMEQQNKKQQQQKKASKQANKKPLRVKKTFPMLRERRERGWKLHTERTYYTTCLGKNDSESPTHKTTMKKNPSDIQAKTKS